MSIILVSGFSDCLKLGIPKTELSTTSESQLQIVHKPGSGFLKVSLTWGTLYIAIFPMIIPVFFTFPRCNRSFYRNAETDARKCLSVHKACHRQMNDHSFTVSSQKVYGAFTVCVLYLHFQTVYLQCRKAEKTNRETGCRANRMSEPNRQTAGTETLQRRQRIKRSSLPSTRNTQNR